MAGPQSWAPPGGVDAALESGYRAAAHHPFLADTWFLAAVRGGGAAAMRRVIAYLEENPTADGANNLPVWMRRAAIATTPLVDAPYVLIALSVFAPLDAKGVAHPATDRHLVVQSANPSASERAITEAVSERMKAGSSLHFSDVHSDAEGAHVVIEGERVRFAELVAFLEALVVAMRAAGTRAGYIRTASSEPWLGTAPQLDPQFPAEVQAHADRAHAVGTDADAFAVGTWCLENHHREHGDAWLNEAASQSDFDMVLRVVDLYAEQHTEWNGERLQDWMSRACRLEFPRIDAPFIRVDGQLFAPIVRNGCAGYGHDTSVQVLSLDPPAAAMALGRAATRFGLVTQDGRVFEDAEQLDAAAPGDDEDSWRAFYTPNFVSGPKDHDGHPSMWMDWKDNMAPRMARAMTHILIDELINTGVDRAVVRPLPR